jgi:hypothetical protein
MIKFKIGIKLLFFSLAMGISHAYGVSLGLGQMSGCIGDTVRVPLRSLTTAGNIAAISLQIDYPASSFQYVGLESNTLPGAGQTVDNAPAPGGSLYVAWWNIQPITLQAGSAIMQLKFVLTAPGNLSFNTFVCEIADGAGDVIPQVSYTNGGVTILQPPAFTLQPPTSVTVPAGGSTSLAAQA